LEVPGAGFQYPLLVAADQKLMHHSEIKMKCTAALRAEFTLPLLVMQIPNKQQQNSLHSLVDSNDRCYNSLGFAHVMRRAIRFCTASCILHRTPFNSLVAHHAASDCLSRKRVHVALPATLSPTYRRHFSRLADLILRARADSERFCTQSGDLFIVLQNQKRSLSHGHDEVSQSEKVIFNLDQWLLP
jgi:hypothetical protein